MTLACSDLTFTWPRAAAAPPLLRGINASFEFGCVTLVTGRTGSGKSTLLHLLAGLLRPTSGEIRDRNHRVSRWTARHRDQWRRQVGICFQGMHLSPDWTAQDNVIQVMVPRNFTWPVMVGRARAILGRLAVAEHKDSAVKHLSGGQQQRVAIARAMVHEPQILLLDEPTAFQDDDHARMLLDEFSRYARAGACVVICSHDQRVRQSGPYRSRLHLSGGRLRRPA